MAVTPEGRPREEPRPGAWFRLRCPTRASCLRFVLACALLAGLLLSPDLWIGSRSFPLCPVWDRLPPIPPGPDRLCYWAMLLLLVAVALIPRTRVPVVAFLVLAAALALGDQTRWQPWFYQYSLMLGAFAVYRPSRGEDHGDRERALLNACRLIVASLYVWSGIQKVNVTFATDTYPWFIEPLVPAAARRLLHTGALLVPAVEIGIGLGLLVRPLRNPAVVLATVMHLVVLLCLGPWGHNWNTVVWPWNVAMVLFVWVLFWRTPALSPGQVLWPGKFVYRWLMLVLFGIMPFFHFLGLWDAYLSAALYSGNTQDAEIDISEVVYYRLPETLQSYCYLGEDGRYRVGLVWWSMGELNVPPYPATRVYLQIGESFQDLADEPGDVLLLVSGPPDWLSGSRRITVHPVMRSRTDP